MARDLSISVTRLSLFPTLVAKMTGKLKLVKYRAGPMIDALWKYIQSHTRSDSGLDVAVSDYYGLVSQHQFGLGYMEQSDYNATFVLAPVLADR